MHSITDWLSGLSGPVVYAVVAALVFAEGAVFVGFVGFVVPGETAAVLGGFLAHQGRVSIGWLALLVVGSAVLGDSTGYGIGRRLGPAILGTRPMRRHERRVADARDLVRRRGPAAVLVGRFVPFVRTVMPALAGISRMPYRRFLPFDALGGLGWGVGSTLLGYFAGAAYSRVESTVGRATALLVAVVAVTALVVWWLRRHRFGRRRR
jgi:membrane-associated protein